VIEGNNLNYLHGKSLPIILLGNNNFFFDFRMNEVDKGEVINSEWKENCVQPVKDTRVQTAVKAFHLV
jgi:hypothetical protein